MSADLELAAGFPQPSQDEWVALVEKVLKGAPVDKLRSTTYDGLTIEPLYVRGDAPAARAVAPHARPDGRWGIRSTVAHPAAAEAGRRALADLVNGTTELSVRFDAAFRSGIAPGAAGWNELGATDGVCITSLDDLDAATEGVLLDLAPVHLQAGAAYMCAAELLEALWQRRGIAADAALGGFGADPLGALAAGGTLPQGLDRAMAEIAELTARTAATYPNVTALAVDTGVHAEAGATEVQELAALLATGAEYLRALNAAGVSASTAAARIEPTITTDADIFAGIAKVRAARRVWDAMLSACGVADTAPRAGLHARTARRMMTRRDPWVNLLRVTAATFAAGVGGADSVTALPFDVALGPSDELGRRMARNTQHLLQDESNVGRVVDPAGGSWYLESLTEQLAERAWALFQEVEAEGGMAAALASGSWAARLAAVREARGANLGRRKDPITGVSEFPLITEAPVVREEPDLAAIRAAAGGAPAGVPALPVGEATVVEALPQVRLAEPYEGLRDAADAAAERPTVFLATLGPVAVHTARATWAANLFAVGGIAAVGDQPLDGAEAAAKAFADSGARIACICSSDALYAEHAAATAEALKAAGAARVLLAGHPGELKDQLTAAGVDEFVHVGIDVYDALLRTHGVLGLITDAKDGAQ